MVGAFFMPGEICAFFMPIFTEGAEQANTALANGDISQEQYDALQREIIETEQDLKKLETQANQSATAMQKIAATGEKLKTTGDNISSAGQKLLPVTAAVTGMGAASFLWYKRGEMGRWRRFWGWRVYGRALCHLRI